MSDGALRTHYTEIDGTRKQCKPAAMVREHVQVFFNEIFWYLHHLYRSETSENVMIIVAYREAVSAPVFVPCQLLLIVSQRRLWSEASAFVQRTFNLSAANMPSLSVLPRVNTIDSSQGQEAPVVFLDCSIQLARSGFRPTDICQ